MNPATTEAEVGLALPRRVARGRGPSGPAWGDGRPPTNVGDAARSARSAPPVPPSRSAPTASTRNGAPASAEASIRAWRLLPEPETRTTSPSGPAVGAGPALTGAAATRRGPRRPGCSPPMASSTSSARNSRPVGGAPGRSRNCRPTHRATRSMTSRVRAVTVQAEQRHGRLGPQPGQPGDLGERPPGHEGARPTTTSTDSTVNHGKSPGCGSAASTGTIGSSPPPTRTSRPSRPGRRGTRCRP